MVFNPYTPIINLGINKKKTRHSRNPYSFLETKEKMMKRHTAERRRLKECSHGCQCHWKEKTRDREGMSRTGRGRGRERRRVLDGDCELHLFVETVVAYTADIPFLSRCGECNCIVSRGESCIRVWFHAVLILCLVHFEHIVASRIVFEHCIHLLYSIQMKLYLEK